MEQPLVNQHVCVLILFINVDIIREILHRRNRENVFSLEKRHPDCDWLIFNAQLLVYMQKIFYLCPRTPIEGLFL